MGRTRVGAGDVAGKAGLGAGTARSGRAPPCHYGGDLQSAAGAEGRHARRKDLRHEPGLGPVLVHPGGRDCKDDVIMTLQVRHVARL